MYTPRGCIGKSNKTCGIRIERTANKGERTWIIEIGLSTPRRNGYATTTEKSTCVAQRGFAYDIQRRGSKERREGENHFLKNRAKPWGYGGYSTSPKSDAKVKARAFSLEVR